MPTKLALASFYTLALLFGFLFAVLFAVMYFLEVINAAWLFGLTIGINVLIWLIGPHITDFIQKLFYKMKFLSREEFQKEYPALEAFIATVARDNKIRFPKMGIIDDQNPTAFTYGSGAFNARIILAKGLFTYLSQEELEAVTAHELGHIVHRDFIVMAIANTIIQLLYELSQVLFRQKGKKGKDKGGALAIIGAVSYIFYWIGYYIVLYLSRIRETFADEFSARATGNPHALSNALIKIAYGMIATGDTKRSDRLIKSTQTLGIMGIKASKGVGLAAMATNMDTQKIGRVLLYDFVSPWAKLAELGSTHPLTGKRLERLDRIAKKIGKQELFQIGHLLQDNIVDKVRSVALRS
ncbi:MAG: Peptidase M48 Ste24p [Parcubacteria group bacterium GW2011_GWA2_44_12]|nr:MAG: Peptidase M48 Ste24p [Parcubacteria group bacterium GW2011_GWA2_44_12]